MPHRCRTFPCNGLEQRRPDRHSRTAEMWRENRIFSRCLRPCSTSWDSNPESPPHPLQSALRSRPWRTSASTARREAPYPLGHRCAQQDTEAPLSDIRTDTQTLNRPHQNHGLFRVLFLTFSRNTSHKATTFEAHPHPLPPLGITGRFDYRHRIIFRQNDWRFR